jgi:hypothetical protein
VIAVAPGVAANPQPARRFAYRLEFVALRSPDPIHRETVLPQHGYDPTKSIAAAITTVGWPTEPANTL